jgi:zinc/manganese transport system substrate-binding protein
MRSSTAGLLVGIGLLLAACGQAAGVGGGGPKVLQVIAAENFWGNLAAQLGGAHVSVTSVVTNPNADPHEYESSAQDARAFAEADYVIVNGAGYDDWATHLLAANASSSRTVFTVADLVGVRAGANPHIWYNPAWVETVANHITADFKRLDPADVASFDQQRMAFESALTPYHHLISTIHAKYAGTPVGATESIFVYLSDALGLKLISPPEFMKAIAEGNDPPAQDVASFHDQLDAKQIEVLVYNVQTVTDITTQFQQLARQRGIPVVGISETLQPVGASFQGWQVRELQALQQALASAS